MTQIRRHLNQSIIHIEQDMFVVVIGPFRVRNKDILILTAGKMDFWWFRIVNCLNLSEIYFKEGHSIAPKTTSASP